MNLIFRRSGHVSLVSQKKSLLRGPKVTQRRKGILKEKDVDREGLACRA